MPVHTRETVVCLEALGAIVGFDRRQEVEMMNFFGTQINNEGLEYLKQPTCLEKLILQGCRNFTDAGLENLCELTKLELLNLWGTPITDSGVEKLAGLVNLVTLLMGNTGITDSGIEHLRNLTSLKVLDLLMTKVTEQGLTRLKQELPNCKN
ncbi:MAG: hypothetical protein IH899_18640 [Planctomycetes bacterium]|nr:hypothetical protein [Planctomycetota bacterium]